MKKLLVTFCVIAISTWLLSSCGGKKEEEKKDATDEYSAYESAEPEKASSDDVIKQGQTLVDNSDCKTCHHTKNRIVGPGHEEVAQKYEFTKANVTMLAGKIINGGSGNWGEVPMTPHPDLTQADAEKMAMYVLSLDGEKMKD